MKKNLSLIVPALAILATASISHAAPAKTFGGVALTEAALPEQASALDLLQTLPAPEAITISGIANSGFFAGETVSDHKVEWVDGTLAREGATLRGLTADTGSGGGAVVNSLFYDLSAGGTATRNIGKINVFSQWQDGRVFHTYDVYTTTDTTPTAGGAWTALLLGVTSGTFGDAHPNPSPGVGADLVSGLTRLEDDAAGNLATGITGVRFDFYNADNTANGYGAPATAAGGSWIREIDIWLTGTSVADWTIMN